MLLSHTTVIAVDIFITWARGGWATCHKDSCVFFSTQKIQSFDFNKPALKGSDSPLDTPELLEVNGKS
jgi:hypothetical protein